ncbi:MAG: hypothetical protein AAB869_04300 [Patescibacteria group bacterium]
MEQPDTMLERLKGNPTPVFIVLGGILLFVFPGALIFLVPVIVGAYAKKFQTKVPGTPMAQQLIKTKDPRRRVLAGLILVVVLLVEYVLAGLDWNDFMGGVMLIGICTGGFVWAPLAAYLIARLLLYIYDKVTGNTAHNDAAPDTTVTLPAVAATVAPTPAITQVSTPAPDLSALSTTDQSLVVYIADASSRGVLGGEITLILKSMGWLDADIARGFELARTYYPGVLK